MTRKRALLVGLAVMVVGAVIWFVTAPSERPQLTLRFDGFETNGAGRFVISNGTHSTYACSHVIVEGWDGKKISPKSNTVRMSLHALAPQRSLTVFSEIPLTNVSFRGAHLLRSATNGFRPIG